MYNGIGLTTPRGSGTNGHVQRNWAVVRPREKDRSYRTEDELAILDTAANKQPNKDILDHDRKRKIELKCAEFADILEEQGYSEGAITNKVNNYRNMLLNHDGKVDKVVDQWGRSCVTETHQVAEAQQEKNAKLREAFGISEYFVDGSSFDPDREAKEQVARSNALLEHERQQQLDKAQAQRYDLVQTPSPEPEAQQPNADAEKKKNKKRKHKNSTSSEEAPSSKKKKKSKKRNKKERSDKGKDKKAKKKRRRSSKASSDDSDDTAVTSNDETSSDEERKKRKRKKKEKKKLKKKQASSKSSDSSRDSSPVTRKQKPIQKSKQPDKIDSKGSASKIDYHRRNSHEDERRRYSQSPPPVQRDRRSRSRERDNNYRGYNPRRRSPEERPQYSPKRTVYKTKYHQANVNRTSPSSEHERECKSRKYEAGRNMDVRQHRDKRSRSKSPRGNRRDRRSRSYSVEKRKQNAYGKRTRSKSNSKRSRSRSVDRLSRQKARRTYSKSPEVLTRQIKTNLDRQRSRSTETKRTDRFGKLAGVLLSPQTELEKEQEHKRQRNVQRHRSKSVDRSMTESRPIVKNRQPEFSPHEKKKKRSVSPRRKSTDEEYSRRHADASSSDDNHRSQNTMKHVPDKYSPRDVSTSPERNTTHRDVQKKKDLGKLNDDLIHKVKDSKKSKLTTRDKSSSPDDKYAGTSRGDGFKQKLPIDEVLSKINDDRRSGNVAEVILSKSSKDISKSPDYNRTKSKSVEQHDKQSITDEVLSKMNADKGVSNRYNRFRTPSPDPKSIRNSEVLKQKLLMEDLAKMNDVSKSVKSTTPPRSTRNSESEKPKKPPKTTTKSREQKPVVCLRSTSDDEDSNSGNVHEDNAELMENEMRVLRLLKSDLAAKAKESLERKRIPTKQTPSPKTSIDPNTFDIQGIGKRDEKVSAQLFPSYVSLVKDGRKCGGRGESASNSPVKKTREKERKSRSRSVESRSRSGKSSKSEERKSRSRSKTKKKSRKSVSSSSASSYSSGHRSSSSSSSSSNSSRSSRSRSRSSSGSRSSSTTSRSRSPSIPRRHGSPSFLDRRRITRK